MSDDRETDSNESIASALASALASHDEGQAQDAPAAQPAEERAPAPAEKPAGKPDKPDKTPAAEKPARPKQRARAPDAAPAAEPAREADKPPETEPKEPDEGAGEAAEKPADKPDPEAPPANWKSSDKAMFRELPAPAKRFVLDRVKSLEADYTRKTQAIAQLKREYEPVDKLFEPHRARMQQAGWTPAKLIEAWSNVERRLMEGDGANVVAGLIRGYKVDLGQVAQALGLRPRGGTAESGVEQPPRPDAPPAQVPSPVEERLQRIQDRLDAQERERLDGLRRWQTGEETRVMNQIEEFKTATDDHGELLHPHFDELEDAMTLLANQARAARKPVPSLEALYEAALWADPSTRQATLAARDRAQREKDAEEARAKAARARKAGSSVTGSPGSGSAPNGRDTSGMSLRQQLDAAYDEQSGGRI